MPVLVEERLRPRLGRERVRSRSRDGGCSDRETEPDLSSDGLSLDAWSWVDDVGLIGP